MAMPRWLIFYDAIMVQSWASPFRLFRCSFLIYLRSQKAILHLSWYNILYSCSLETFSLVRLFTFLFLQSWKWESEQLAWKGFISLPHLSQPCGDRSPNVGNIFFSKVVHFFMQVSTWKPFFLMYESLGVAPSPITICNVSSVLYPSYVCNIVSSTLITEHQALNVV
jgi:hypothetical protein